MKPSATVSAMEHSLPNETTWSPPVYDMSRHPREAYATQIFRQGQGQSEDTSGDSTVFARMARW